MVDIYESFNMCALGELIDPRHKAETMNDMYAIENVVDGLRCWVTEKQQLFVYSEKEADWIQIPIVIPTSVNNPLNGSVRFDVPTKQQLTFYDGYWYNSMGEVYTGESSSDKFYTSTIDKVVDPDTGMTLREVINQIYSQIAAMRSVSRLTNETKTKAIITQDGLRILI